MDVLELYRVAFIGHRRIYEIRSLQERLQDILYDLLRKHEYVEFYVGINGSFDTFAASAVKNAQKRRDTKNSSLILVLPYHMTNESFYEKFYDEIMFPVDFKIHPKSAITKRNEWLMENSDLLISYVTNRSGGAYTAIRYAEKRGVPTLNLAETVE